MVDAKRLGATLLEVVRAWVEPAFTAVCQRIEALERRVPVPGPKGERGEAGGAGERGEQGPAGRDADPELVRLSVAEILPPMVDKAAALLREHLDAALPTLKGERGDAGAPGNDGESIHPDTVRAMVDERVRMAVGDMPRPKDGEPGRDASAIEYRDGIDETKSYPRGTHALYRGGVIVALRATDPLGDGDLTAAGWGVAMNGTHTDIEESLDEGRAVRRTVAFTNGKTLTTERKTSVTIYRGVYLHDREYSRGDMVTSDGSVWHCEDDATRTKPPGPAWKLAVKRGNHGKDGKDK